MGQINILISINTEKLLKDLPNGGIIKKPDDYAFVQDDEAFETRDQNVAEITTKVNPGTVLMWTINSISDKHKVQLTNIEANPGIFLEAPLLFCDKRKCVAVISKILQTQVKYGYYIEFYLDGDTSKTWYWDPYVEQDPTKPPPKP